MSVLSIRRRPPVWIALLAMLWQLLLPWSPALANDGLVGELIPVCTSTGLKWIAPGDSTPTETGVHQDRTHCALCVFGDFHPALHDAREPLAVLAAASSAPRATDVPAPHTAPPHAIPPSRAPPLHA